MWSILFPGVATLSTLFVRCRLFLSSPYLKRQVSSPGSFTHMFLGMFLLLAIFLFYQVAICLFFHVAIILLVNMKLDVLWSMDIHMVTRNSLGSFCLLMWSVYCLRLTCHGCSKWMKTPHACFILVCWVAWLGLWAEVAWWLDLIGFLFSMLEQTWV